MPILGRAQRFPLEDGQGAIDGVAGAVEHFVPEGVHPLADEGQHDLIDIAAGRPGGFDLLVLPLAPLVPKLSLGTSAASVDAAAKLQIKSIAGELVDLLAALDLLD